MIATSASIATRTPLLDEIATALGSRLVGAYTDCRQHSPATSVDELAAEARRQRADAIVSIGGSSVFDTVKVATSRLADAIEADPVPQVAIPTTLSAGEFTPGAGITDTHHSTKQLLTDRRVLPRIVILDPEATVYTPESLWLSTGIKAIEHAVEALWCHQSHPVIDTLALEAIRLLTEHLPLSRHPSNLDARGACQIAAWMSISSVSGSGIRLSHFIAHQIGAYWQIPHGLTACVILPTVMRYLAPDTLEVQARIANAMKAGTATASEQPEAPAADLLEQFITDLGLPTRIRDVAFGDDAVEPVAAACMTAAVSLGLIGDLPNGHRDIAALLRRAW